MTRSVASWAVLAPGAAKKRASSAVKLPELPELGWTNPSRTILLVPYTKSEIIRGALGSSIPGALANTKLSAPLPPESVS